MKVYVDEMPKSCEKCPCFFEDYECVYCKLGLEKDWYEIVEVHDLKDGGSIKRYQIEPPKDCPLKLIVDHDKQVRADERKKACEDCWGKEQPKELIKRIAELEKENAKLKAKIKQLNKDWKRDVRELEYDLICTEEELKKALKTN